MRMWTITLGGIVAAAISAAAVALRHRWALQQPRVKVFSERPEIPAAKFRESVGVAADIDRISGIRRAIARVACIDEGVVYASDKVCTFDDGLPFWDEPDWWSFAAELEMASGIVLDEQRLHRLRTNVESLPDPTVRDLVEHVLKRDGE